MVDFSRIYAIKMAKLEGSNEYEINSYLEAYKWLHYVPEHEESRFIILGACLQIELTQSEISELAKYRERAFLANLFAKYGTNSFSDRDGYFVHGFLESNKIEELMEDRLTDVEKEEAKRKLVGIICCDIKSLKKKIKEEKEPSKYMELSMVDSYVLHKACKYVQQESLGGIDTCFEKGRQKAIGTRIYAKLNNK